MIHPRPVIAPFDFVPEYKLTPEIKSYIKEVDPDSFESSPFMVNPISTDPITGGLKGFGFSSPADIGFNLRIRDLRLKFNITNNGKEQAIIPLITGQYFDTANDYRNNVMANNNIDIAFDSSSILSYTGEEKISDLKTLSSFNEFIYRASLINPIMLRIHQINCQANNSRQFGCAILYERYLANGFVTSMAIRFGDDPKAADNILTTMVSNHNVYQYTFDAMCGLLVEVLPETQVTYELNIGHSEARL